MRSQVRIEGKCWNIQFDLCYFRQHIHELAGVTPDSIG